MEQVKIVAAIPLYRRAWGRLYAGYAAFYEVEQTEEMRDRVWSWIQDQDHEVEALIALDTDGEPVGLAHFRNFARPLAAGTGGYLDDLFVDPAFRGRGVVDALFAALKAKGRERGWGVIRWITAEDNYRARAVYDRTAQRTRWVTYDIALTSPP